MESYLKETNTTYKKECRIFAKVDSKVTLYGVPANKETWTSVSLKPRLKSVYLIATRDLRISGCNFFYLKIKGLCDFLRKRF